MLASSMMMYRRQTKSLLLLSSVGPVTIPYIVRAPRSTAVLESPGMPSARAVVKAPPIDALFDAHVVARPSIEPSPYSSGCLETRLETSQDISAEMSPPVPGTIPTTTPIIEPIKAGSAILRCSALVGSTRSFLPTTAISSFLLSFTFSNIWYSISPMPNRPIKTGIKEIPSSSATLPPTKRLLPSIGSRPIVLSRRPSAPTTSPFARATWEMLIIMERPKMASQKYSAEPNFRAKLARGSQAIIRATVEKIPPMTE